MRYVIIFLLLFQYSCGQQHGQKVNSVNPEAKKLNDSAMKLAMQSGYAAAVDLLDQATLIDSNYFSAYINKFYFQGLIKPFNTEKILGILKSMNRLRPLDPEYYMNIGLIYFKKGDTTLASFYFNDALSHFNNILDTMHNTTPGHDLLVVNKAYTLIFQKHNQEGHDLLKNLFESSKDTLLREMLKPALQKTRQQIIDSIAFE